MSATPPPSSPPISRLSGFMLGAIVFLCILLIGFAGYVKYELDLAAIGFSGANPAPAQGQIQFWGMLLTVISWCSLIIAAAVTAAIYLTLRNRQSAPMRALAQSISNMASGDMRNPIWGMERPDMIGELARAVDRARHHFSHLPDMSLLSEQGPVRIRFEGNTRSLFEAMMQVISKDSEAIREQANGLTEAINRQQDAITLISSRVEAVLHNVEKRGMDGDQRIKQALQSALASAESLKNAQERAAEQLNRILPYLQDRAHGMAEITQITGKQVAQILQSMTVTERGLRASAEQSQEAIKKISSVGDNLGERLFGAINLLQASGKVLAETTEKTQSRLNEAINMLSTGAAPHPVLPDVMAHLETVAAALAASQRKLEDRIVELGRTPKAEDTAQEPVYVEKLMVEIKVGFDTIARQIEEARGQFFVATTASATEVPSDLTAQMRDQWYQMAAQIEATRTKLEQTIVQQINRIDERLSHIGEPKPVAEPVISEETQKQMQQQAQILSELVTTLSLLDEHMQQLKSEIGQQGELPEASAQAT